MSVTEKVCTKCGPPAQPIENFPWKSRLRGIPHAVCKTCTAKRSGDWYEDNKDRQLEYVRNIIKKTARLQENMLGNIYLHILAVSAEKLIRSF